MKRRRCVCISYNMPKRYVAGLWIRDPRARRGVSINRNIPIRHVLIDL